MFSPRLIMVAMIALLTAADTAAVSAGHRRPRAYKPRRHRYVCPECPRYQMIDPCEVFPDPNPDMSTRDEPAPAPLTDSEKPERSDETDQPRPSDRTTPPSPPQQPQAPQTATPTFTQAPSRQPTTAATSPLSAAPNMIGDFFGNSPTFSVSTPSIAQILPSAIPSTPLVVTNSPGLTGSYQFGNLIYNNPNFNVTNFPTSFSSAISVDIIENAMDMGNPQANPLTGQPWDDDPGFDRFPVQSDSPIVPFQTANRQGYVVFLGGTATLDEALPADDNNVTPNATGTQAPAGITGAEDLFVLTVDAAVVDVLNVQVPVGALAGRIKLAENSSPMPRDRIIFDYTYFDNLALAPGGVNVNRFTPGFEKTFLNGEASFEIRAPFASTLDSDIGLVNRSGMPAGLLNPPVFGASNHTDIEFGNLLTSFKFLLYQTRNFAFSGGLSLAFPTADDVRVSLPNGVESFRVSNEDVHVMPFLGAVWAPNSRFFAQAFLQVDATTRGNEVFANLNPNELAFFDPITGAATPITAPAGLQSVGRINDPTFLYADASLGYWLYRNTCCNAGITGIAGLLELHYNTTLESFDSVSAVIPGTDVPVPDPMNPGENLDLTQRFRINGPDEFDALTVVVGGTIEMKRNTTFQLGYGVPIAEDKVFDGELRANFNHYFGRSARRSPLTRAGSL